MGILFLVLSVCVWYADGFGVQRSSPEEVGIYGGDAVNISEVPFFAIFHPVEFKNWCGASIVTEQFLVTAAHCVFVDEVMNVTVGTNKIGGGKDYEVAAIFVHPKYHLVDFDIAVLKLKEKLTFGDTVQPIKLVERDLVIQPGEVLDTMGFGAKENGYSDALLKVNLPYMDVKTCNDRFNHTPEVTESMLCAGGEEGKSACFGDSGGPLRYKGKLAGVVSWGHVPCASKDYPTVFTRISVMRDFIDDTIKNES